MAARIGRSGTIGRPLRAGNYNKLMSSTRIRRAGRKTGPKPRFTREDVINAAVELGIDRFTLGAVAAKLGIATSAMYRLFDSRDALVDACLAQAAAEISMIMLDDELPWPELLRNWAETTWNICEKYPGLDITIFQYTQSFSHVQGFTQHAMGILMAQGFARSEALFALDFIGDTVLATHIGMSAMQHSLEGMDIVRRTITELSAETLLDNRDCWNPQRGFLDVKVEFIIAGLRQQLGQRATEKT